MYSIYFRSYICTTLHFLLLLSSYVLAMLLFLFITDNEDNVKCRGKTKGRAVLHFIRNNKVIFVFTELVIQSVAWLVDVIQISNIRKSINH